MNHDHNAHAPPGPERAAAAQAGGRRANPRGGGVARHLTPALERLLAPTTDVADTAAIVAHPGPEQLEPGVLVLERVVLAVPHGSTSPALERWTMALADGAAADVWLPGSSGIQLRLALPAHGFVNVPRWRQNAAHDAHIRSLPGCRVKVGPAARKRATMLVECHDGSEHAIEVPVAALDDLLADLEDEGVTA